jgi:hypothetical protein
MERLSPDSVGAGKRLLQAAWRAGDGRALGAERGWQRRVMGRRNQRIAMERNRKGEEIPWADRGP